MPLAVASAVIMMMVGAAMIVMGIAIATVSARSDMKSVTSEVRAMVSI